MLEITAKEEAKIRLKLLDGANILIDKSKETIKEGLMLTSDGEYDAYKGAVGLKIASEVYRAIFNKDKIDNNIQVVFTSPIPTSYEVNNNATGNYNKLESTSETV